MVGAGESSKSSCVREWEKKGLIGKSYGTSSSGNTPPSFFWSKMMLKVSFRSQLNFPARWSCTPSCDAAMWQYWLGRALDLFLQSF